MVAGKCPPTSRIAFNCELSRSRSVVIGGLKATKAQVLGRRFSSTESGSSRSSAQSTFAKEARRLRSRSEKISFIVLGKGATMTFRFSEIICSRHPPAPCANSQNILPLFLMGYASALRECYPDVEYENRRLDPSVGRASRQSECF